MGLFAFNRMRLKLVEEMKPENIEQRKAKEEVTEAKAEEIKVEEPKPKEAKRGSRRK